MNVALLIVTMFTTWFSTQVLPGLISAASGAIFGVVVAGWDKLAARIMLNKIGPSIKTIYNIVDPILEASLKGWCENDVNKVIALAVEVVNDGQLSADEVNKAVKLISKLWLPQIATQKVLDGLISEKENTIAQKIREAVDTKTLNTPDLLNTLKATYIK
ncbi:hypothetical protein [Synechococcus lacustris]|nr:hypothetical protein [Synechococcus lacustris]